MAEKLVQERCAVKSDIRVAATNDDATSSKRSASRLGYFVDNWLPVFCTKKPVRRTPLINRFYTLRWRGMTAFSDSILESFRRQTKEDKSLRDGVKYNVLSLGCGYETYALRRYHSHQDARFIEIDFPAVVTAKSVLIARAVLNAISQKNMSNASTTPQSSLSNTEEISTKQRKKQMKREKLNAVGEIKVDAVDDFPCIGPLKEDIILQQFASVTCDDNTKNEVVLPAGFSVIKPATTQEREIHAPRLDCIGFDLSTITNARETFLDIVANRNDNNFDPNLPTLITAEVVLQYMNPEDSLALLQWCSKAFPNSVLLTLDQVNQTITQNKFLPFSQDSYALAMTNGYAKKNSPLKGLTIANHDDNLKISYNKNFTGTPVAIATRLTRHAGFTGGGMRAANFFQTSSAEKVLPKQINQPHKMIDDIEPCDELEEWALKGCHYCFCLAWGPGGDGSMKEIQSDIERSLYPLFQIDVDTYYNARAPTRVPVLAPARQQPLVSAEGQSLDQLAFEGWGHSMCCFTWGQMQIAVIFGGFSYTSTNRVPGRKNELHLVSLQQENSDGILRWRLSSSRDNTSSLQLLRATRPPVIGTEFERLFEANPCGDPPPDSRMYHTMHHISGIAEANIHVFLVFGGRDGPMKAFGDAFLLMLWPKTHDLQGHVQNFQFYYRWDKLSQTGLYLPQPRYRHTCSQVQTGAAWAVGNHTILLGETFLVGGKGQDGSVFDDAWHGALVSCQNEVAESFLQLKWKKLQLNSASGALYSIGHLMNAAAAMMPSRKHMVLLCGGVRNSWCVNQSTFVPDSSFGACGDTILIDLLHESISKINKDCEPLQIRRFGHTLFVTSGKQFKSPTWYCIGGVGTDCSELNSADLYHLPTESTIESFQINLQTATVENHNLHPCDGGSSFPMIRHAAVPIFHGAEGLSFFTCGGGYTAEVTGTVLCPPQLIVIQDSASIQINDQGNDPFIEHAHPSNVLTSNQVQYPRLERQINCGTDDGRPGVVDPSAWKAALTTRLPTVFHNCFIGKCVGRWCDQSYLIVSAGSTEIKVHEHSGENGAQRFDFVKRNFKMKQVTFADMVNQCFSTKSEETSQSTTKNWYFRSVGANFRNERSDFYSSFPGLANDFLLPDAMRPQCGYNEISSLHQSCLRINQVGMHLWTHYDVMDNILVEMVGRKRVVLFPPHQRNNMYLPTNYPPHVDSNDKSAAAALNAYKNSAAGSSSSSRVENIDTLDCARFPRFAEAIRHGIEVFLEPGDILFIPALWFHHISCPEQSCISVNLFWHGMPPANYDQKDLYGNRDIPAAINIKTKILSLLMQELKKERPADDTQSKRKESENYIPDGHFFREFIALDIANTIEQMVKEHAFS